MSNLKALKLRIGSAKSVKKITHVMKVTAAVKLKIARKKLTQAEQNFNLISHSFNYIIKNIESQKNLPNILQTTQETDQELWLIFTSDRGLCGSFNQSITKVVKNEHDKKSADLICIGNKSREILQKKCNANIIESFNNILPEYETAQKITQAIFNAYSNKQYKSCKIFYAIPKSIISQEVTCLQMLPLNNNNMASNGDKHEFALEDKLSALDSLIDIAISAHIYKILIESLVSEYSARVTAMENATNNAKTMIEKLTINYNRSRQAEITKDLIEVTSGAEALAN